MNSGMLYGTFGGTRFINMLLQYYLGIQYSSCSTSVLLTQSTIRVKNLCDQRVKMNFDVIDHAGQSLLSTFNTLSNSFYFGHSSCLHGNVLQFHQRNGCLENGAKRDNNISTLSCVACFINNIHYSPKCYSNI